MIDRMSGAPTKNHPVRTAFMDETGTISVDRFFAVGVLLLDEPSDIAGELRRIRDRRRWSHEWHLKDATEKTLPEYKAVVDILASRSGWNFEYIILDREISPISKEESKYRTYELMAAELIQNAIRGSELLVVVSDYYPMPAPYTLEKTVRETINTSVGRLVVPALLHIPLPCRRKTGLLELGQRPIQAGTRGSSAALLLAPLVVCGSMDSEVPQQKFHTRRDALCS